MTNTLRATTPDKRWSRRFMLAVTSALMIVGLSVGSSAPAYAATSVTVCFYSASQPTYDTIVAETSRGNYTITRGDCLSGLYNGDNKLRVRTNYANSWKYRTSTGSGWGPWSGCHTALRYDPGSASSHQLRGYRSSICTN